MDRQLHSSISGQELRPHVVRSLPKERERGAPKRPERGSLEGAAHRIRTERLAERLKKLGDALETVRALYTHEPSAIAAELLVALKVGAAEINALTTEGVESIYETRDE
ncbi:MAG: hypothetical protein JOZ19_09155 [Rubrobacter sp.]|nr:hypothetical protein [Rubrobacter sp.]